MAALRPLPILPVPVPAVVAPPTSSARGARRPDPNCSRWRPRASPRPSAASTASPSAGEPASRKTRCVIGASTSDTPSTTSTFRYVYIRYITITTASPTRSPHRHFLKRIWNKTLVCLNSWFLVTSPLGLKAKVGSQPDIQPPPLPNILVPNWYRRALHCLCCGVEMYILYCLYCRMGSNSCNSAVINASVSTRWIFSVRRRRNTSRVSNHRSKQESYPKWVLLFKVQRAESRACWKNRPNYKTNPLIISDLFGRGRWGGGVGDVTYISFF